jgi:hypothetical protein
MRVRNEGREAVSLPFKRWRKKGEGSVSLALHIEPGETSEDIDLNLDPNDPGVRAMLRAKRLRVIEVPTRFQRILKEFDDEDLFDLIYERWGHKFKALTADAVEDGLDELEAPVAALQKLVRMARDDGPLEPVEERLGGVLAAEVQVVGVERK